MQLFIPIQGLQNVSKRDYHTGTRKGNQIIKYQIVIIKYLSVKF